MAKDHSGNIFEEAADFGKPKESKTKITQSSSSSPFRLDLSNMDLEKMMQRAAQIKKDLNENINESLAQAGIDIKRLRDFAANPNNFTQEQWKKLEREKKRIEEKLKQLLTEDTVLDDITAQGAAPQAKSAGRKAQSLGAKKKNWIPIK